MSLADAVDLVFACLSAALALMILGVLAGLYLIAIDCNWTK
jgi:hypothetical protein